MTGNGYSWDDLRLFLSVAQADGLAAASRLSGVSAATLSRRIKRLEDALGTVLFLRHAHGYALTPDGERLLHHVEEIGRKVLDAERLTRGTTQVETVRISAGTWTALYLIENIRHLRSPDDGFRLSFVSSERRADFKRREAVIGLRNQRPTEQHLATRRLGQYAVASYAASPAVTGWIDVAVDTASARWVRAQHGDDVAIEVNAPRNALDLALQGQGQVVLPCFVGDHMPGLVRTSTTIAELTHDIWLVLHEVDRHRPAIRIAIERLIALITQDEPRLLGAPAHQ